LYWIYYAATEGVMSLVADLVPVQAGHRLRVVQRRHRIAASGLLSPAFPGVGGCGFDRPHLPVWFAMALLAGDFWRLLTVRPRAARNQLPAELDVGRKG
jgi:hypothetical protein